MELQLKLVETAAHHVHHCLGEAMKVECNGCLVDHPSQIKHECVMLEGEEFIRFCLNKALALVDWDEVKSSFWQRLDIHHMVKCPPCYDKSLFFKKLWQDEYWKNQLVSALLAKQI